MEQLIPQDVIVRYLELDSYAPHERAKGWVIDWVVDYLRYTHDLAWVNERFSEIHQELAAARQFVADRVAEAGE
jgi:hypothetical protein